MYFSDVNNSGLFLTYKRVLKAIYTLPYAGGLCAYIIAGLTGIPWLLGLRFLFWLRKFQKIKCGTCTVWVPEDKKNTVIDAFDFLKACDPEMFSRVTKKRRLFVYYMGNNTTRVMNAFGFVFGIHERYFKVGEQGVALYLVQSFMISESYPGLNPYRWKWDHGVMRQVLNWMSQHYFRPAVVQRYQKSVENTEKYCNL